MPAKTDHETLKRTLKSAAIKRENETSKKQPVKAERPTQGLKQTDLVAFNQSAEKAAVEYLRGYIRQHGAPTFNTACSLIALELGVSTETAKRYLRKYSVEHPKAAFSIDDGHVKLRRP